MFNDSLDDLDVPLSLFYPVIQYFLEIVQPVLECAHADDGRPYPGDGGRTE